MKSRVALALALSVLAVPASALDRPVPGQPLGKVILGAGSSGDGSAIRVQPQAGGLPAPLSEILGRSANPLDFKTSTNTDADTIRALYAKWPDTHLVTISDVTRNYPAANIPRQSASAQDHVFLWPGPYPGGPEFRPNFPGLHVMPIGNRLEIFRGQPRPFDGGEDIRMTRDRMNSPGGETTQQNAQLTLINKVRDSNSSEWPLLVTMATYGAGLGQHVGISSYGDRYGGGSLWNFVGGITDHLGDPTMGVAGMELAIRATGGDASRLRTVLDIIGKGNRPDPANDNLYASEIANGVRITSDNGDVGYPAQTRILKPINIHTLWGLNTGAIDIETKEKVGTSRDDTLNYFRAFNLEDTFAIRSRRLNDVSAGTSNYETLGLDLVRQRGSSLTEVSKLTLMPGYVETFQLNVTNGITAAGGITAGGLVKASQVELDVDNLQVANDNASATTTIKGRFYRTADGTLKIKF